MLKGVITKGIGGFYYIDCDGIIYECRARGRFRIKHITPLVGDWVEIEVDEKTKQGYILNILDRKNEMLRPAIANIDQVIIVVAAKKPDINMQMLQKFLIYVALKQLDIVVCINKIDLDIDQDYLSVVDMIKTIPYPVLLTSAVTGEGIEDLKACLKDKISVFAGPSGAGKSSLLNDVQPGLKFKTGDLSKKIDRGAHTTRHAELATLSFGGLIADTPGFTSLDISEIEYAKLQFCFPEFQVDEGCRFTSCLHNSEPDCGVKKAVLEEKISQVRYQYYLTLLNELKNNRRY